MAIIGVGPAGLSAAVTAEQKNLTYIAIEQGKVLSTIHGYPKNKYVFFNPVGTQAHGALPIAGKGDQREKLLDEWEDLKTSCGGKIKEGESCVEVKRSEDGEYFVVNTEKGKEREPFTYLAHRVILAVGKSGARRMLNPEYVEPGTAADRVRYELTDPESFKGKRIAVVGGGNSAVEAAIALVARRDGDEIVFRPPEETNEVSLLVRSAFTEDLKFENKMLIYRCFDAGKVTLYIGAAVKELRPGQVVIWDSNKKEKKSIPNDYILAMIGGGYPYELLRKIGIVIPKPEG